MNKIATIGVPSSAGARRVGQDRAPQSFREAGMVEALRATGLEVLDAGDLDHTVFRPDTQNPKQQNIVLVRDTAARLAEQVSTVVAENAKPIVLGGDCTITIGVLAGLIRKSPNLGLMYFDGDVDLNTPETTHSGIFDGMVMSHITGDGAELLTHLGSRYPLMPEESIVLFGYNLDAGWVDEAEVQRLAKSSMVKYPASEIRAKAGIAAAEALRKLEVRVQQVLVHFDVDVIDSREFPAADVLHEQGISFDEAMECLRVFVSSSKFAGLVITEFNANRDENGALARRLVHEVVSMLGDAQRFWKDAVPARS